MQRSFGFDVLACPRCGDRFELIALIEGPLVIRRILSHLGLMLEWFDRVGYDVNIAEIAQRCGVAPTSFADWAGSVRWK